MEMEGIGLKHEPMLDMHAKIETKTMILFEWLQFLLWFGILSSFKIHLIIQWSGRILKSLS